MTDPSLILGRPLPMTSRSPALSSFPLHYQARQQAHQTAPPDDIFGPAPPSGSSASPVVVAGTPSPSPRTDVHKTPKLRQSPTFRKPALSPPMSAASLPSLAGTFSDDSIGGLSSTFGAQLRKGSRSAPWEEEDEAEASMLDQRSNAGDTEGDHEAGWAALGLTNVDSVERRGSSQTRLRSPPTTMYLRPISAREQYGQPRTPHSASLAAAIYAFPTPPDENDSPSTSACYSTAASNLRQGLPSPSPSPEQHTNATPTRPHVSRARAPLRDISNLKHGVASVKAVVSPAQIQHKLSLGQEASLSSNLPPLPLRQSETAPQKVIRAKKSLLKMFAKASSTMSTAPPVPATSSATPSHLGPASHYQKISNGRFPSPEPAGEPYSFMAPMTELSVRGCGESDFAPSPSPSLLSLSVEAPSRPATPPATHSATALQNSVSRSVTDASIESTLSDATASPAPVESLRLRPISQAWAAGLPTDFFSLSQASPNPSTLLSPGSLRSSLPSPSASSFATSCWSDASSVIESVSSIVTSSPGEDKDAVIRRLEEELSETSKAWAIERLEFQTEIRHLQAALAHRCTQAPPSPSAASQIPPSSEAVSRHSDPAEGIPERVSIMDRGRVKTGGGRATFGRGDLRT